MDQLWNLKMRWPWIKEETAKQNWSNNNMKNSEPMMWGGFYVGPGSLDHVMVNFLKLEK